MTDQSYFFRLTPADITEVDRDYVPGLMCIRDMDGDAKAFAAMDMAFSTPSAAGQEKYSFLIG